MALTQLNIDHFRNLIAVKLEPIPTGFNFIYGHNGSGKTSLLEAIYYLSLGRSFRSPVLSRVIHTAADKFCIFAKVLATSDQLVSVGIERYLVGDNKIRIAGKHINSTAELADLTPVQLINSYCYNLLDAGPAYRRKYLDWGSFYHNNTFFAAWRDFTQALKQRNANLRQGQRSKQELESWTQALASKALKLDQLRKEYVNQLLPFLRETLLELISLPDLKIHYYPGWDDAQAYLDILTQMYDKDVQIGHTQAGPHRADLKITINKIAAKDILSRGQQKLFVCAMILAQGALLQGCANKKPIYLIDDLPAELDVMSRSKLIALLSKQETQIFVTAVEREALGSTFSMLPRKMFHVEHGNLTDVT